MGSYDLEPVLGIEDDLVKLGDRFHTASDESSSINHRLCRANGEQYNTPALGLRASPSRVERGGSMKIGGWGGAWMVSVR